MRPRNVGKQPHRGTYVRAWPCVCGKRGYKERSEAREVVKQMRRDGKTRSDRVDTYICDADPDFWHVGHRAHNFGRTNLNDPNSYTPFDIGGAA